MHRAIMFWVILNRNCNQIAMSSNCMAKGPLQTLLISFIVVDKKKKKGRRKKRKKKGRKEKKRLLCLKEDKYKNLAMRLGCRKMNCSFYNNNNNLFHHGTGQQMIKDEQRSPRVWIYIRPFNPFGYSSGN